MAAPNHVLGQNAPYKPILRDYGALWNRTQWRFLSDTAVFVTKVPDAARSRLRQTPNLWTLRVDGFRHYLRDNAAEKLVGFVITSA